MFSYAFEKILKRIKRSPQRDEIPQKCNEIFQNVANNLCGTKYHLYITLTYITLIVLLFQWNTVLDVNLIIQTIIFYLLGLSKNKSLSE